MLLLERCIRFIASLGALSAGASGVDREMRLDDFVTSVLCIDASEWAAVSTPSLAEGVRLSSLGSAYVAPTIPQSHSFDMAI
jgi:hypothetical protein